MTTAQNITVQQPVVENFGVSTTVSVPDRGEILLGGTSTARSGRSTAGFFPPSRGIAQDRSSSSVTAKVWIHDLATMDEMLLNGETRSATGSPLAPAVDPVSALREGRFAKGSNRYPGTTDRQILRRSPAVISAGFPVRETNDSFRPSLSKTMSPQAASYLARGKKAETEGNAIMARAYYRTAMQYGSAEGRTRLERLGGVVSGSRGE